MFVSIKKHNYSFSRRSGNSLDNEQTLGAKSFNFDTVHTGATHAKRMHGVGDKRHSLFPFFTFLTEKKFVLSSRTKRYKPLLWYTYRLSVYGIN